MSCSTPPTYSGSTGGVLGKVTYQVPDSFFGQARSLLQHRPPYPLPSTKRTSKNRNSRVFVGGYCASLSREELDDHSLCGPWV